MKQRSISICLVIIIIFYGCKKVDSNICHQGGQSSDIEVSRGNIYYVHSINYSEVIEYDVFKKYGFIDYLQFYPITIDSCFRAVMDKKIETKINGQISFLDEEVQKSKQREESIMPTPENNNPQYADGIYCTLGNTAYPLLKYPLSETDFRKSLTDAIKEKIDKNYKSSSFWIVINKKGRIESIERYKKHSNEVDSYIESKLKNTIWFPSLNKRDSTFVKSRIKFLLKG